MAVSPEFRDFVIDQLSAAAPQVTWKPMFGGVGIYSQGVFFALAADDVLYLFTPPEDRAACQAEGLLSFHSGAYYELPASTLENLDELRVRAQAAIQAKRRHETRRAKRKS